MTAAPLFPGFDGLMTLSRREGVDIRPTLLRVLTDLYVQTNAHTDDEVRQFVELTSLLGFTDLCKIVTHHFLNYSEFQAQHICVCKVRKQFSFVGYIDVLFLPVWTDLMLGGN